MNTDTYEATVKSIMTVRFTDDTEEIQVDARTDDGRKVAFSEPRLGRIAVGDVLRITVVSGPAPEEKAG